jgi:hypothetical protein
MRPREGEMGDEERRLTDEQVARVLDRAAGIERSLPSPGLTVAQLQEVAVEAGIPPEALSQALHEMARFQHPIEGARHAWFDFECTTFAPAISDEDLAWLLRLLGHMDRIEAGVHYRDGFFQWTTPDGLDVQLFLHPRATQIRVRRDDQPHLFKVGLLFVAAGSAWAAALLLPSVASLQESLMVGSAAGVASLLGYMKVRVGRMRTRVAKLSSGISNALAMIVRRGQGSDDEV